MPLSTMEQLESELADIFRNASSGVVSDTQSKVRKKHPQVVTSENGRSGQGVTLMSEEVSHYAQMGIEYLRELQPVGELETSNAQLIFETRWRLHRIRALEAGSIRFSQTMKTENKRHLVMIDRYETSLIRRVNGLTGELERLQARRSKASPDLAFDEDTNPAMLFYRRMLSDTN